jgi:ABC-type transport system involved in multi-copper enzyme maturation permease subunit
MTRFVTNPMILKELRQRLRESRAWLLPTLYLLVLAGTVSFAYYAAVDPAIGGGQREVQGADIGEVIFLTVVITQLVVLLLMAPVFSAGSLTIEKEQRTVAGLITSLLTAPQIWWGKFVAALLYLLLLLFSALPLLTLALAFGGVDPAQLFKVVGSTVLVLASICTLGLWCSSMFRRSVHSTAACYGFVLVLSIVTAVVFGFLVAHWESHNVMARAEGPPAYVQAPMFLNPFYPLLAMLGGGAFSQFTYPVSSWLLFTSLGCLAAAFAMRRIQRSGEQL